MLCSTFKIIYVNFDFKISATITILLHKISFQRFWLNFTVYAIKPQLFHNYCGLCSGPISRSKFAVLFKIMPMSMTQFIDKIKKDWKDFHSFKLCNDLHCIEIL